MKSQHYFAVWPRELTRSARVVLELVKPVVGTVWGYELMQDGGRGEFEEKVALGTQVQVEIVVSAAGRAVAQPGFDHVHVGTAFQEMNGGGVADAVGGQFFTGHAGCGEAGAAEVDCEPTADAVASEGATALVDEDPRFWVGGPPFVEFFEEESSGLPERTTTGATSFALKLNRGGFIPEDVSPTQAGYFRSASSGIVKYG